MTVKTYVATAGLEAAPIQDGAVLYNLKTSKFIMLNKSAAALWTELATQQTHEQLAAVLQRAFTGVTPAQAERAAAQAVEDMQALEIVSVSGAAGEKPAAAPKAPESAPAAYEAPSAKVLDEEELLKVFQMTAAEISVASCWWGACTAGCP
ncbi:MAG TPA: PqqD family protein [Burkholderiales bacterium]|nr:PqqD family protein [Burkholderiales bacterium]